MRILMVNKFLYANGGSETYMIKLGNYLKSIGHEVEYFGMQHELNIVGNKYGKYTRRVDYRNNSIKLWNTAKTALNSIYSMEARLLIKELIETFKPEIVHLNNINFQITPSIIFEIKRHGIPIVQTVHDVQIACPNHRFYIEHTGQICDLCQFGKYYNCMKNKCVMNSISKSFLATVESYFYHSLDTYNRVDKYICPSKFVADKIMTAGVDPNRIVIQHNYFESVKRIELSTTEDYVLYFGRLSKEKGIETLISIFKDLPNIKIKLAGSGPLLHEVQSASLTHTNIEYVGQLGGNDLHKLISGAKFTVYPSEWYENCPLSVIESQSLGVPVIGSDLGGTKELIRDEVTGLVFKGCDMSSFKSSIIRLWNDASLLSEMKKNCQISQSNSLEAYSEKLLDIYGELIQKQYKFER